jgi:uncharacterized protein (DUF433 family)
MIDWSKCDVVESVPDKLGGAWVFRGTRLPLKSLFDNLAAGASTADFAEWFDVDEAQVQKVLQFAAVHSDPSEVPAAVV